MLQLNSLPKVTKNRKRVGRGGSRGGTSGRGHKGQKARTGSSNELKPFFEGGQMPLARRVPRRGFNNPTRRDIRIVNLSTLEAHFQAGEVVDRESLKAKGLIKGVGNFLIKVLGSGELSKALTVKADAFSQSAIAAITKSKGSAQLNEEMSSGSVGA